MFRTFCFFVFKHKWIALTSPNAIWIPPHSAHSRWFYTRRVESIFHSLSHSSRLLLGFRLLTSQSRGRLPTTFCFLCCKRVQPACLIKSAWCVTLRAVRLSVAMKKCEKAPPSYGRNQTRLIFLFSNFRSHFSPHSPVSFYYRTCKYHWFLFSSFYYRVVYISFPSSCQWSSLSLCILCKYISFFTIQNVNTAKKKNLPTSHVCWWSFSLFLVVQWK